MTIIEFITVLTSSLGISAVTAGWLAQKFIEHRLTKDIEHTKNELQTQLNREKATWDGKIRAQVETVLGDRAADREYVLEARKRLYGAIGPLRFQLLLACRDLAGRVSSHGLRKAYDTDIRGYYGQGLLFRVLRPLTLAELVERQITYADFSVDAGAIDLLRFKKHAFAIFSGDSLVGEHSGVEWGHQEQHVFFDYLSRAANALIVDTEEHGERCMRFHEFEAFVMRDPQAKAVEPFPDILRDFTPTSKPLFWLRLVAYAYVCNEYINQGGGSIGFETRTFPLTDLLQVSADPEITGAIAEYEERCRAIRSSPL